MELIVLNDRINNKAQGLPFQEIINSKGDFYFSSPESMVHHKFCIVDVGTDNAIVITGSYNWTYYAENRNWENVIIIEDKGVVEAYEEEFRRLVNSHNKVQDVLKARNTAAQFTPFEFLQDDYLFQAKQETRNGYLVNAAKIYSELLKKNKNNKIAFTEKEKILRAITNQSLEFCPFEIGIKFNNGYCAIIPAQTKLPVEIKKNGSAPDDNLTTLWVTIQKGEIEPETIMDFKLEEMKPSKKDQEKIEHVLNVEQNGWLTVTANELNGYNKSKTMRVDLKKLL